MNGNEDEQVPAPRGVSSLLSQFEALAAAKSHHEHPDRASSIHHLPHPHFGVKGRSKPRPASTPPSPNVDGQFDYFGGAAAGGGHLDEGQKRLRISPSEPELRRSAGSRSGSTSVASASPLRTPDSEDGPALPSKSASLDKPAVPPRPVSHSASLDVDHVAIKARRAPPPPVPLRKKAATIAVGPIEDQHRDRPPPIPDRPLATNIAAPADAGIGIPLGTRTLSPAPSVSPLISPRSAEVPVTVREAVDGVTPSAPRHLGEVNGMDASPTAPLRPSQTQSDAGDVATAGLPLPPPLPVRRMAPTGSTSSMKPPIPARADLLSTSLPMTGRRSSATDMAVPVEVSHRLPEMKKTISDQGIKSDFLPPPTRSHATRPVLARPSEPPSASHSDSEGEGEEPTAPEKKALDDLPDATYASRLAPELRQPRVIHSKSTLTSVTSHGTHLVTCGSHHIHVYAAESGTQVISIALPGEPRTTFVEFRGPKSSQKENERDEDGRHVWVGCKDGQLFGVDLLVGEITNSRSNAHSSPITGIFRRNTDMLTLDESGKLQVWLGSQVGYEAGLGETTPRTYRIERSSFAALFDGKLWTATHVPRTGSIATANRAPLIRVYAPFAEDAGGFILLPRPVQPPDTSGPVGAVTAAAVIQAAPGQVFLGHETGHISIWSSETYECIDVLRIAGIGITALCGAGPLLWAGYRSGVINVYEVKSRPWKVVKAWKGHKDAVMSIFVDASSLWLVRTPFFSDTEHNVEILQTSSLHVISVGLDQVVHFWDGFLQSDWICYHSQKREAEFCTYDSLRVLICSWNLDAAKPSDLTLDVGGADFLPAMLSSVDSPDVIVFGFQELIDLEDKRLTAKTLLFGRKRTDMLHSDQISSQYRLWQDKLIRAVRLAMPAQQPYSISHTESLVGLFTCVFVKNSIRVRLRDMDISTVKTGLGGRYGNKGAIASRFVVDDSSFCFVNCHLSAGQSHKRQRNKDLIEILETKAPFAEFHPSSGADAWISGGDGAMIFDHSTIFLSGDLNYRVDLRRDTVINSVQSNKLEALLAQDQLSKEMRSNAAFRLKSFDEAPITFAPTYKYDRGTDTYDSSEKARAPAWCDRILWRMNDPAAVQSLHYKRHEARISDHRPISAGFVVRTRRINYEQKRSIEAEIAKNWPAYEQSLLAKSKAFHEHSR